MKKESKKPIWLFILPIIIGGISILFFNIDILTAVIGALLIGWTAISCWDLAKKIKSNPYIAYFIGLIFFLLGWAVYFIYYVSKNPELKRKLKKMNRGQINIIWILVDILIGVVFVLMPLAAGKIDANFITFSIVLVISVILQIIYNFLSR